jgi:hypothetical protein
MILKLKNRQPVMELATNRFDNNTEFINALNTLKKQLPTKDLGFNLSH